LRSWWSQKRTSSVEARADSPTRLAALCSSAPCELRRLRLSQPPRSPERSTWATNHFRGAPEYAGPPVLPRPLSTSAENQDLLLDTPAGVTRRTDQNFHHSNHVLGARASPCGITAF